MAFIDEFPDSLITVVADATFGHRIDKSELAEFDAAVANNEIVCPPAGAVGRGDAFVLSIANKVGATILSNDSYQEFHGTYTWLFDEGRLTDPTGQTADFRHCLIVLTTNLAFSEWPTIFPSATSAIALIDRIVHHADVIQIEGKSWRLREAEEAKRKPRRKKP